MDKVYVVYLDGRMYKDNNRKCAYLEISGAKQVVTADSKKIAHNMYDNAEAKQCWYDLTKEQKQKWYEKAKTRFEIREFVERS